jgi:hypothetical protein
MSIAPEDHHDVYRGRAGLWGPYRGIIVEEVQDPRGA